jgi:hypothetical protein
MHQNPKPPCRDARDVSPAGRVRTVAPPCAHEVARRAVTLSSTGAAPPVEAWEDRLTPARAAQAMAAPERVQLLTGEGVFNADEVGAFLTQPARHAWASRYRTVAIMGPQSSGKSTLLNQLFGTAFVEMDAMAGRSRTTQGVWLAQAKGAEDPPVLVLDLEVRRSQHRRKFPRFPPEPRSHPLQPARVGAGRRRRSAGEDRRTRAGSSTLAVFVKPRSYARTIRSTATAWLTRGGCCWGWDGALRATTGASAARMTRRSRNRRRCSRWRCPTC